jgi:hypothetical protein
MSAELTYALRTGQKIAAIKAVREAAGTSLIASKGIVEAIFEAFPPAAASPRVGGGEHDRVTIKSLPDGGYLVTDAESTFGCMPRDLSAHTTLPEALAFAGKSLR